MRINFGSAFFMNLVISCLGISTNLEQLMMMKKAADEFAKNHLIRENDFESFVSKNDFSTNSIIEFSKQIDIAPGIVVGRLQKEGYINFSWHNELKERYSIIL